VPETYYLDDGATTKSMDKVTVSPGNDLKIECEVASPGSVLSWSFKTDDKDIGFGVRHKSANDDKEREVLPTTRVDSHLMEQDGSLVCEQAGKFSTNGETQSQQKSLPHDSHHSYCAVM